MKNALMYIMVAFFTPIGIALLIPLMIVFMACYLWCVTIVWLFPNWAENRDQNERTIENLNRQRAERAEQAERLLGK